MAESAIWDPPPHTRRGGGLPGNAIHSAAVAETLPASHCFFASAAPKEPPTTPHTPPPSRLRPRYFTPHPHPLSTPSPSRLPSGPLLRHNPHRGRECVSAKCHTPSHPPPPPHPLPIPSPSQPPHTTVSQTSQYPTTPSFSSLPLSPPLSPFPHQPRNRSRATKCIGATTTESAILCGPPPPGGGCHAPPRNSAVVETRFHRSRLVPPVRNHQPTTPRTPPPLVCELPLNITSSPPFFFPPAPPIPSQITATVAPVSGWCCSVTPGSCCSLPITPPLPIPIPFSPLTAPSV